MSHSPALAQNVPYNEAAYQEGVGDHTPVATPPHSLRAHEADPFPAFAELDQPPEVGAKKGGCHVIGVPAKRRVGPTRIRRFLARRPATPQTWQVRVAYPALAPQSLPEYRFVELGMAPGAGEATHVYEVVGPRFPEEPQELLEGSRRVPGGEDEAAGTLRVGPTQHCAYSASFLRCNTRRRELVAGAAHGLDVARVLGVWLYLLTDVLDVHVGRPRLAEELPVPEVAHDLLAAVDPPGVGGQNREHVELFGRQLHRCAFRENLPAKEVHPQTRELQGVLLLGRGLRIEAPPPEVRPHAAHQLARSEGLGHVVVRADLESHHDARLVVAGGQHDDRRVGRG